MNMNMPPRENYRNPFDEPMEMPMGGMGMRADIFEQGDNYIIETDMPGFTKDNVSIGYENGYLNVLAQKANATEDNNKNYLRRERYFGQQKRSFYVGQIDESQVKAQFDNGILRVAVPKKQLPGSNQRQISIE